MVNEKKANQHQTKTLILVADDDPLIQEVLQTKLKKSDYEVAIAKDGHETLAKIADRMPDLLILDIKMPGIDGYEVCRRLREDEGTRALPILMLTAYGGVDHIVKGLEAGADDYVTKPFHIEEVLVRISSLLRVRQIEKELREKETSLARVEAVGQFLVTMAHHINNSLAIVKGRAQNAEANDPLLVGKLKDACLKETKRISAVLESLKEMANRMKISTTGYAGLEEAMLDIEKEIARRIEEVNED